MIFTLAARELRSLFLAPIAWVVLAVVQAISALLFLLMIDSFMAVQTQLLGMDDAPGVTEAVAMPLFSNVAVILLLATPLLSMRLISEERRNRTLSLLFSAPITMTEIVLGKYLALLAFLAIVIVLVALMPLALLAGTTLDWGLLAAGALGLLLLLAAFAAVGLFMSSLVQSPTIAAIATFGALLLLWVIDGAGAAGPMQEFLRYLSLTSHYQAFLKGVFDSADAAYYLLFIAFFLGLSIRRLDADRLGG